MSFTKLSQIGYSLKDVAILPAPISYLNHRDEPNPFIEICGKKSYPIFVSPMAAVTDENNYKIWIQNGLTPVVPRSVQMRINFAQRMKIAEETFVSVSLKEAQEDLMNYEIPENVKIIYICIDIAHGTLSNLYDACKKLKEKFGDKIEIMTGNVANPDAYKFYADIGIEWMRASIGTGSRCTSSANVAIHYPSASLIDALFIERKKYAHYHNGCAPTKIILDGGVTWFDDIQKALCLGANAVMGGNIFARAEEACGEIKYAESIEDCIKGKIYSKEEVKDHPDKVLKPFRDYYGMSTKSAQKITGGTGTKTAEGISKPVPIEYPIAKWVDNMQSYLRSCMTYTNSQTIKEMREHAQVIILGFSGDSSYRK